MYPCRACVKTFATAKTLFRHVTETHGSPKHFCGSCRKTFRRLDALKIHTSGGKCIQTNPCNLNEARVDPGNSIQDLRKLEVDPEMGRENGYSECTQVGSGSSRTSKPTVDYLETVDEDSEDGSEHEASSQEDIFDRENDDAEEDSMNIDTENSSDDSDCDFSGDESSSDSADGDEESEACCEDEAGDGGDSVEDEESTSNVSHRLHSLPKFGGFARWRSEDEGLYVFWISQTRKPYVVQHREWLAKLLKPPYKLWKSLICEASDSQLETFREIAVNILEGRAAMHTKTFKYFKKNVDALRTLASDQSDYKTLRRTLKAGRDGLLPMILVNVIPKCIKSPKTVFQ